MMFPSFYYVSTLYGSKYVSTNILMRTNVTLGSGSSETSDYDDLLGDHIIPKFKCTDGTLRLTWPITC